MARLAPLFVIVALAAPAGAADPPDVFTVAAVPVDATAANANAARDTARLDGQRRAYQILLDRLTLAADHDRLPKANDAQLNDLISGFEVAKERTSGVRYLADYTFHFRAEAVRRALRQANIPFAETPSKPVVVLALYVGQGKPVLWEDPNPWRDAWSRRPPPAGLVPLVLPYGDLEDVAAIDAETASSADATRLQAVGARYGGADVLVTQATLKADADPHRLDVTSTRYAATAAATAPGAAVQVSLAATPGESDADLMARAVAATAAQIGEAWKRANILDFGKSDAIVVRVPLSDLQSWIAVRDRLVGIPSIQRSTLLALDRTEARVSIRFFGDANQLRVALAQRDLQLSGDSPDWVLEQRAAAPKP
jgi:hypothetical protein